MATAADLYEQLAPNRLTYLTRARACSVLTIPTLVPPEGHGPSTVYPTPYQSVGARGLNNLASKLLLSLLPNSPFFRFQADDFTLNKVTGGDPAARAQAEKTFNRMERAVMTEVETIGLRAPVFEVLKQLIVAGNVLLYLPKDGRPRVFKLDSYVVQRDPFGNLLRAIMREEVALEAFTEEDKLATGAGQETSAQPQKGKGVPTAMVYTHYWREGGKFRVHQEVNGKMLPGSDGEFDLDKGPVMALRWTTVDGEDYGRSYVEEYLGDLQSLEGLMEAIIQGAAASARLLVLVAPNGTTRLKDVQDAPNGAVLSGIASDVTMLQTNKSADLAVAQQTAQGITDRLSYAFLMSTAVQRNAERVTAEEVRFMATELETALGGVYSILAQDLQLPLAVRLVDRMTKQKRLPKLPKGFVRPTIVTGLEALGRGNDLTKYQALIANASPLGPEVMQRINVGDLLTRIGTSLGIDMDGLIKTDDDLAKERQAAEEAQQRALMAETASKMASGATPNAVKAAAESMNTNG